MKKLKITLWFAAIGCLASVPFIFLPWSVIQHIGAWSGVHDLPDTPVIIYFFKTVFGVFGLIGVFFAILAMAPLKYGPMLDLAAWGSILFGLLAIGTGLFLELPGIVFLGDGLFGIVAGIAILLFAVQSRQEN